MKICFIGTSLTAFSGTSKPIFELAKELQKQNHEVELISDCLDPNVDTVNNEVITKFNYQTIPVRRISGSLIRQFLFKKNIPSEISQSILDSDIIHGVDFLSLYSVSRYFGSSMKSPLICSVTGDLQLKLSEIKRFGMNGLINMAKPDFLFKAACPAFLFKNFFSHFDGVISSSQYMAHEIRSTIFPKNRVDVIRVGLNFNQIGDYSKNLENDGIKFLYFGSGSKFRGLPDVLMAFENIQQDDPSVKLTLGLLGFHGSEERYFQQQVRKKFSDTINLKSFIPDIYQLIQEHDAVVLPFTSTFGYSHPPLTLLESMAMGKPVISTKIGSMPEIISDGETGFLTDPGNIRELTARMAMLKDPDTRKNIGLNARNYIFNNHNIQKTGDLTIEIYKRYVEGTAGSE